MTPFKKSQSPSNLLPWYTTPVTNLPVTLPVTNLMGNSENRARSDSHYSRFATFEGFARPLYFKL